MKYMLSHRTSYTYASSVDSAHHIAHLRAREFPGQKVSAIGVDISPAPALAVQHFDYFGNHIDIYRIDKPHTRFDIEVRAAVDVRLADPPPAASTPPWEEIRAALIGDGFPLAVEASEFVHESPLLPEVEALQAYGAQSFTAGRPILAAARELTSRIKADFEYHPAPPTSARRSPKSSPAGRASAGFRPCRDRGATRPWLGRPLCLGLPPHRATPRTRLRYVARCESRLGGGVVRRGGRLGPSRPDQRSGGQGRSRRRRLGRDFSDVSPLRGVILGGESHSYGVAVTLIPTA